MSGYAHRKAARTEKCCIEWLRIPFQSIADGSACRSDHCPEAEDLQKFHWTEMPAAEVRACPSALGTVSIFETDQPDNYLWKCCRQDPEAVSEIPHKDLLSGN